ncbi:MAG TPA: GFA family protein [Xanthobacteraceae bacterium]|jgi:hypothetical protein|nr:GFA family protein [Xanthobacteraceae bacterium]
MSDEPGEKIAGRCLCGDIRYEYWGAPVATLHCHCESCRRHTSAPITTFVCVSKDRFRYMRGAPTAYASSPGVSRTHCGRCGSPIAYESGRHPDQIDLYTGTLDDPTAAQPTCHVHTAAQLPWLETTDPLPRYERGRRGATPVRYGPRDQKSVISNQ